MVKIEFRSKGMDMSIYRLPSIKTLQDCIKDPNIDKESVNICINRANKELMPKGIKLGLQSVGEKTWSKDLIERGVDYIIIMRKSRK